MHIGPRHKTVRVRCNGMDARIDERLAPLIRRLWQFKIMTFNCCQENRPGISWIEFATANDAAMFLNIVASHYLPSKKDLKNYKFWDTIYGRMTRPSFGEWEYTTLVRNEGEELGRVEFDFSVSVRFPQTDLPAIIAAFNTLAFRLYKKEKYGEIHAEQSGSEG